MWQKTPVYEKFPILTNNGKIRYIKEIVKQPRDIECWFAFALNSDIDGLKRMLARNMNINIQNLEYKNIGVLACEYNLSKVFQFFIESGGQLSELNLESCLGHSFQEIVCSPQVRLTIFKYLFSKQYLHKIISNYSKEELIYQLSKTELFCSDKNIQKIKYFVKLFSKEEQFSIKNMIFYHISSTDIAIPKILYFVSNKEHLKTRLNNKLKTPSTYTKKLKI